MTYRIINEREWISVDDKLPSAYEAVLIIKSPEWIYPIPAFFMYDLGVCVWHTTGKYEEDYENMKQLEHAPTHWMPLPDPPSHGLG